MPTIIEDVNQPSAGMLQYVLPNLYTVDLHQKVVNMKIKEKVDIFENSKNKEILKGYITGFFDAEGMVRLEPTGTSLIAITQVYRPILDYIKNIFKEGNVNIHSKEGYDERGIHRKGAYRWRATSTKIIPFLEYIEPYSIEKRDQIGLMLQYLKGIKPQFERSLTECQKEQRQLYVNRLEELKHRKDSIYYIPYMPDDIKIGYCTGFFDGEGYVGIEKGKRDSYSLNVQMNNLNLDILNLFKNTFGGKIRPLDNKHKWQWYLNQDETLNFLKYIYSHSKVKKNEIKLAMEFQKWHNDIRVIRTPEHKSKADWYYTTLQQLKKCTDGNICESCKSYNESILTEEDIIKSQMTLEKARLIRTYNVNSPTVTYKEMSEKFNVHISTIGRILNNETWTDNNAPPALNKIRKVRKHTFEEATDIRADYENGLSYYDLAEKYDTTPTTISNIINNKVLKDNKCIPIKKNDEIKFRSRYDNQEIK